MNRTLSKILFWTFVVMFAAFLGISEYYVNTAECPNGYGEGAIVEHLTGNVRGVILDCRNNVVEVDIGDKVRVWRWTHVIEFQENR